LYAPQTKILEGGTSDLSNNRDHVAIQKNAVYSTMEFVPTVYTTSTVWKDGHRIQPICTVRFQVSASPTTRESMSGGAQVCSTYDAQHAPIETVHQMFNDALLLDEGAACVAHLILSGCFQAVRLGDLGPLPASIAHSDPDSRLTLNCGISTSPTGIYFHVYFRDFVDMVDARMGNVMRLDFMRAFNSHLSAHPPDDARRINHNHGAFHAKNDHGGYKIVWKMCATSNCELDSVGSERPYQHPLARYATNPIEVRYSIHAEVRGFDAYAHAPNAFLYNLTTNLMDFMRMYDRTDGTNTDQGIRNELYFRLLHVCSDINDDHDIMLDAPVPVRRDKAGLYYGNRYKKKYPQTPKYTDWTHWEIRDTPNFTHRPNTRHLAREE
jgi:hypothetical protein